VDESGNPFGVWRTEDELLSLEKEHAGQEHEEGGEKLNGSVGQRAAATWLQLWLRFSFLQKALRVFHVPLHAASGLQLLN